MTKVKLQSDAGQLGGYRVAHTFAFRKANKHYSKDK